MPPRTSLLGWAAAVAIMATAAPAAFAAPNTDMGTIKVHEGATENPPQQNDPHVQCDFFIEGFHIDDTGGALTIADWPPTGNGTIVLNDRWTGTAEADGKGDHFLNGPYNLTTAGHYRVEIFGDAGHPGNAPHSLKSKVFWVDECGGGGSAQGTPCPSDLAAQAQGNGDVLITWSAVTGADSYTVERAIGAGSFAVLGTVTTTSFLDTGTTPGTTYTYRVSATIDGQTSPGCDIVEVTAVPDLPTPLAAGLAAIGGLAAYATWRRR